MATETAAVCQHDAHVFTPLRPGWEPDEQTPCDCGTVSWGEHARAGIRAKVEASLAAEADKRRTPPAPGPNPEICNAVHPTQGICGGAMSMAIKGRRTGLWIRTCRECLATTGTTEAPAYTERQAPHILPTPGEMFTPIETLWHEELDARARQVGSE